ncbi:MAG: glycogen debranching protein GlgX [Acidobacteriota bacterium]
MSKSATSAGECRNLGVTVTPEGVNFCVFSKNATRVDLLLFSDPDSAGPSREISLSPVENRTFYYWHILVKGLKPGQLYGFRVHGPWAPEKGMRFNPAKVLLDPYSRAVVVNDIYDREAACGKEDNSGSCMKSVVAPIDGYDWEGDAPLHRPLGETIIYEMHVGGFTLHENSGVSPEKKGTYAGLIEKIPYLKSLGITAVELLPVYQFDRHDAPEGLPNYWGYSPVSFFAPHREYSSDKSTLGPINEFRDMVKALHRDGIEVILDVVYNHTAEGNENGPTVCWKGFENSVYYILEKDTSVYSNYSGTGNTLSTNHSIVRKMILDSLHYWVEEMHVDGFRFDLASVLTRGETGELLKNPPIPWDIESDTVLAKTKLIAEAWDAGGLYQVGSFVGDRWQEWNGMFRDDVRRFFRGDPGTARNLAPRLIASPDLYGHEKREPEQSINFITCHDGFTVNDLVSFNQKRNLDNRENNRDGSDENYSWNCGAEGPSDSSEIESLRNRQVKNFLATTLLSLGTPMILMGDETRRTQRGNNNAYCQNNEISWFDWSLLDKHSDILRFVKESIRLRYDLGFTFNIRKSELNRVLARNSIEWHGVKLHHPDWSASSHSLAVYIHNKINNKLIYVAFNSHWKPLKFELPPVDPAGPWKMVMNTAETSPADITPYPDALEITEPEFTVQSRSIITLVTDYLG